MTPDLLHALADVIANLRDMYDDVDGETHMPREDSDEICKAVTEIAKALGCKDDWGCVADGIRALAASAEHADKIDAATNAALLATITAAHGNDLTAASEAATLALTLMGLDGALAVRVVYADAIAAPGLPEGWMDGGACNYGSGTRYAAEGPTGREVALFIQCDGRAWWEQHAHAPPAVYAYLLARAGVVS